jgi:hypothetical protein
MSHVIANQEATNPEAIDIAFLKFAQKWIIPSEIRGAFSVQTESNTPSHLLLKFQIHFQDGKNWLLSSFEINETLGRYIVYGPMEDECNHNVADQTCRWLGHIGEGPVVSLRSSSEFFLDFKNDILKAANNHMSNAEQIRAYFQK